MSKQRVTLQPDYSKWQQVQLGMTYDQVVELLGAPSDKMRSPGQNYYAEFGRIIAPGIPNPSFHYFTVGFDKEERVWNISDPFGGVFSPDGMPSKPRMIIPLEDSEFGHYPRTIDFRWIPVSGVYPMAYQLQIEVSTPLTNGEYHLFEEFGDIKGPYFVLNFVGACRGRVRVRGVNGLGSGEWSDFRRFSFSV